MASLQRENSEGKCSCVSIFLKENPNATEMEAIHYFNILCDDAMKVVVKEYLRDTNLPNKCKQVHLNMAKILNFFYSKGDGHTLASVMSNHVKKLLYISIP